MTLNSEFADILSEITREAAVANLSSNAGFSVFVSNDGANGTVSGTISAVTNTALALNGHSITSQALAESAVASAVTVLGSRQGTIGTLQNRMQFAISLAQNQIASNQAAESRIRGCQHR